MANRVLEHWNDRIEQTQKYKLRIKNKIIVTNLFLLFPLLRLEGFKLQVLKDGNDYTQVEASIFIKTKNLFLYLKEEKKRCTSRRYLQII